MEVKKFNYMLDSDILRNSSQIFLGALFKGLGVQKDTQTPCCLRLCPRLYKCINVACGLKPECMIKAITHTIQIASRVLF